MLYVNGDSHTAAAEAVVSAAFAEDAGYPELGRQPHPDNIAISWGKRLSQILKLPFICDAESAASNQRIIRTASEWVKNLPKEQPCLMIIQWSTWEREEWLHNQEYLQVGSSGLDSVPEELKDQYQHFVLTVDWQQKQEYWHKEIWDFHQTLNKLNIPHIFFNGNNWFDKVSSKYDWGNSYLDPYQQSGTYDYILKNAGFQTVNAKSWHFGKEAHYFWANFMLQYAVQHLLIPSS